MKKLFLLLLVVGCAGCASLCPVVSLIADASKEACPVVVEFLGEDGKTYQVQVPREHMVEAAGAAAAKQGVPAPKAEVTAEKAAP